VDALVRLFPVSKFAVPRAPAGLVDRPELVAALMKDVFATPLTVVSAPAGYGKTVLVSSLAAHTDVCWVSLDADDNEPERFLTALTVALAGRTDAARGPAALLTAADEVPDRFRRVATAWLNAAGALDDVVVVLDEWELITDERVRAHLAYLVEWAPPALHLVLTTRHDPGLPLARLRAHGALTERGPGDLRFTLGETETLLNGIFGIGRADAHRVHALTEGWPAVLRLLAASAGPGRLPDVLAAGREHVFDYLCEELFTHQPPEIRRFLIETAALTELTAEACAALTGREDAAALLEDLAHHGPFPLGSLGDGYRYHPLFADFLRSRLARLPGAERRDVHCRAAHAETDPAAAAGHLLTAGAADEAAALLASAGVALLQHGRAESVRELLAALPPETVAAHPELRAIAGELAFRAADYPAAQRHFEHALTAAKPDACGQLLSRLVECRSMQGDVSGGAALIDQALAEELPGPIRARLLVAAFQFAQIQGHHDRAETILAHALGPAATADRETVEAVAHQINAAQCLTRGGVRLVAGFAAAANAVLPAETGPTRLRIDGAMTMVEALRGDVEQAVAGVARVSAGLIPFGGAPGCLGCTMGMVAVSAAGAGLSTAPLDEVIAELVSSSELITKASFMYANLWYVIGRARWLRGRHDLAREARERMVVPGVWPPGSLAILELNQLCLDGLLAFTDGEHGSAEQLLRKAVTAEDALRLVNIYGSARMQLAALHAALGRPDAALATAQPALAQADRAHQGGRILFEGAPVIPVLRLAAARGPHRDYAGALLRKLDHRVEPLRVPGTGELITPREVEVLRLLSGGATNREIAEHLVIGQETVKTHVTRVLRKLGVRSRTAAATRARELGVG
jgi:LuxR family maltose regulon positive regulatory protein